MPELKTSRPYQERFLDGYDRSQLRREVQKAKRTKMTGLRKKYATWALGASLALGGIGVPMKMIQDAQSRSTERVPSSDASTSDAPVDLGIAADLKTAA